MISQTTPGQEGGVMTLTTVTSCSSQWSVVWSAGVVSVKLPLLLAGLREAWWSRGLDMAGIDDSWCVLVAGLVGVCLYSARLSLCVSICLVCLSVCLHASCRPASMAAYTYTCIPICMPACIMPVCLYACLPSCLLACIDAYLPVCLPKCPHVCLPTCVPAYLHACLHYACLLSCFYQPVCLRCIPTWFPFPILCTSLTERNASLHLCISANGSNDVTIPSGDVSILRVPVIPGSGVSVPAGGGVAVCGGGCRRHLVSQGTLS